MVATIASLIESTQTNLVKFFQSAFHRGNGCYTTLIFPSIQTVMTFSPLFIAAMVATVYNEDGSLVYRAFSPLFIAAMVATKRVYGRRKRGIGFQSAFHRGNGCYFESQTGCH